MKYAYHIFRDYVNERIEGYGDVNLDGLMSLTHNGYQILSSTYVPLFEEQDKDDKKKIRKHGFIEYVLRKPIDFESTGFMSKEEREKANYIMKYIIKYFENQHTLEMLYGSKYTDISKLTIADIIEKIDRIEMKYD